MSRPGPVERRAAALERCRRTVFDAAIIGGGVNGAAIFDELSRRNYRVVLLDKGDFACGTSQASAMMVWGSLPDIGRLRFIRVGRLCRARERLLIAKPSWVAPKTFRYLPSADSGRGYFSAVAALYSYWLLGRARRSRPVGRTDFPELSFLRRENFRYSLEYEEACVAPSDARFVLDLILANDGSENPALNYCCLQGGSYSRTDGTWNLEVSDTILRRETEIRARAVINAAGSWTDCINRQFNIETPYKHVLSKGVFIAVNRDPRHSVPLMIETRQTEGRLALIPWGPISLWGPTESLIDSPADGFTVDAEDVRFLCDQLNRHLAESISADDLVSLRCGIRALAVKRSSYRANGSSSSIFRSFRVHADRDRSWISIYGGKLTSCLELAAAGEKAVRGMVTAPSGSGRGYRPAGLHPETATFPGLDGQVLSPAWCAENELCWTLEDYLRRRTNIGQWAIRGGLGTGDENREHLVGIAGVFTERENAHTVVDRYSAKIAAEFDSVLAAAAGELSSLSNRSTQVPNE